MKLFDVVPNLVEIFSYWDRQGFWLQDLLIAFKRFNKEKGKNFVIKSEELEVLRHNIAQCEKFFYDSAWVMAPDRLKPDSRLEPYTMFWVPATIANMLTKFKEDLKGVELDDFDRTRLSSFVGDVTRFSEDLFRNDLKRVMSGSDIKKARDVFQSSLKSVRFEIGDSGDISCGLYFMKTCLIAAELLRREQSNPEYIFIPDLMIPGEVNKYIIFDFSQGQKLMHHQMHLPTHRTAFAKFVVMYLRSKVFNQ